MTDWTLASLDATTAAIASGTLRARDLAEQTLDRIDRFSDVLGCFVEVDADSYRAAATAADRQMGDGLPLSRLHGIPLAHKDMFHRQGRATAFGSKVPAIPRAPATATVLDRLDRAGALDTGRLVMVEFAMGPHGFNANYPLCRNPWDLQHVPCGSSSGSGVAVAARLVHGSLGSDAGGSVRCPAAANGVVGLLPTHGLVSRYGMMPGSPSLDGVGPLARTVQDLAILLDVIAGPDENDLSVFDVMPGSFEAATRDASIRPRIGIARGYFDDALHPEIGKAIEAAAAELRRAGLDVVDVAVPVDLLNEVAELHPLIMKAEAASNHLVALRDHQDLYTPEVGNRLQSGLFIPASDYLAALESRARLLRAFVRDAFARCDVILTSTLGVRVPTIAETSSKSGQAYLDMVVALTRNTKVVNYLGLPALSLPCGYDSLGLPIGMQLIGRPFDEAALLRAGQIYQSRTGWHEELPRLGTDRKY